MIKILPDAYNKFIDITFSGKRHIYAKILQIKLVWRSIFYTR